MTDCRFGCGLITRFASELEVVDAGVTRALPRLVHYLLKLVVSLVESGGTTNCSR